ncbi:MAG: hypothetical protein JWO82_3478 [Akkermansiaceae bacterium]|nr:hypothetical protein [Akkermansiaceae bacterium]
MDYTEYEELVAQATAYLKAANTKVNRFFGIGDCAFYQYDLRNREIWWSDPGVPKVRAQVTIVGSTSAESDTWMWSWANPHLQDVDIGPIAQVREFGADAGIAKLTDPTWPGTEDDAWEMTAIASRLLEAEGAYRSPGKNGSLFLLYDNPEFIPEEERAKYLPKK